MLYHCINCTSQEPWIWAPKVSINSPDWNLPLGVDALNSSGTFLSSRTTSWLGSASQGADFEKSYTGGSSRKLTVESCGQCMFVIVFTSNELSTLDNQVSPSGGKNRVFCRMIYSRALVLCGTVFRSHHRVRAFRAGAVQLVLQSFNVACSLQHHLKCRIFEFQ